MSEKVIAGVFFVTVLPLVICLSVLFNADAERLVLLVKLADQLALTQAIQVFAGCAGLATPFAVLVLLMMGFHGLMAGNS